MDIRALNKFLLKGCFSCKQTNFVIYELTHLRYLVTRENALILNT